MLFRNWERYVDACHSLCELNDKPVRTCLRWRQAAGLLVIRVTNDHQTLTFKACSSSYLNRFELLNSRLLAHYWNRKDPYSAAVKANQEGLSPSHPSTSVQAGAEGDAIDEREMLHLEVEKGKKRKSRKKAK